MITFSILIVLYKSPLHLIRENLMNIRYEDFEVVIVDNSEDEQYFTSIINWVKDLPDFLQKKIKLHRSPKNGGYTNGNNIAFRFSTGKYLLILNPDIRLGENFLRKAQKILDLRKDWAILSSKIYFDLKSKILLISYYILKKYSHFPFFTPSSKKLDEGQFNKYYETFYANGSSLIIRRELFKTLRGFDETYFMYTEETDLCYRAKLMNAISVYCPSLIVEHVREYKSSVFADRLIIRNNLYFFGKFFSLGVLFVQYIFSLIRIEAMSHDIENHRTDYSKIFPLLKAMNEGLKMGLKAHIK